MRRDIYFWDSWDRKVRGEDDLRQFFAIAEQIGGCLDSLQRSPAATLLPGTVPEIIGTRTNLFLPDFWLFVVHHLGWTDQLPYECNLQWGEGCKFTDSTFGVTSRLPVNVVQGSIDALTVLIDALPNDDVPEKADSPHQEIGAPTEDSSSILKSTASLALEISRRVDAPTTAADKPDQLPVSTHEDDSPESPATSSSKEQRKKRRSDRVCNIEALKLELIQYLRAAREHAQSAADFGREPTQLPRPSRKELAGALGITESAVSRCFNDPQAIELNFLWNTAGDLEGIQDYLRG